ncbi:UNKNOWN [Stylonychia lemnae]|uniref:Uncharacterized protein n=1 Tax=Stylonychia lemnae TaxID=5949 RepID=A0A078ABA2_STYLE|nr:UNKNOWN [Stylonychia lemnae]|eukprot:CDW79575.1 UNKNOWN [Stylonychia lemnae]
MKVMIVSAYEMMQQEKKHTFAHKSEQINPEYIYKSNNGYGNPKILLRQLLNGMENKIFTSLPMLRNYIHKKQTSNQDQNLRIDILLVATLIPYFYFQNFLKLTGIKQSMFEVVQTQKTGKSINCKKPEYSFECSFAGVKERSTNQITREITKNDEKQF